MKSSRTHSSGRAAARILALRLIPAFALALGLAACSGGDELGTGGTGGSGTTSTGTTNGTTTGTGGSGNTTGTGGAGGTGTGGAGTGGMGAGGMGTGGMGAGGMGTGGMGAGGGAPVVLDDILAELRADRDGTMQKYALLGGWPLPIDNGRLFVSTDTSLNLAAGDHDSWKGTALTADQGFNYAVIPAPDGDHYKFTDGSTYKADPWARAYTYDQYGEISLVKPADPHLERWPGIGDAAMAPRTLRVWVPSAPVTHVMYVHDGQNLFDPDAFFGGWKLQESAPAGMMLVGIDNTPDRMDEYTHVPDVIQGMQLGGKGDEYADYLKGTVRPLIAARYGEPAKVGVMGSSLGGLISFHVADHDPGDYVFAASLSGTMGWGSIGANAHFETMIERYVAHGKQGTVLYLDSGGGGNCVDSDGDGIKDDDPSNEDNYCENAQLRDMLTDPLTMMGNEYLIGDPNIPDATSDLYHWHEPGAQHNEAAWAARVFRPLNIFKSL